MIFPSPPAWVLWMWRPGFRLWLGSSLVCRVLQALPRTHTLCRLYVGSTYGGRTRTRTLCTVHTPLLHTPLKAPRLAVR
ncbi:hypothetical protein BZA05DRAFT_385023 [Tricharina praecox]|uniref:uncharacterized protein n=1 Tax=Tricharina praecox TaxID=43433 RepID=UPI00221FDCF6|nr:uncharacterized protein BZA05DRAFT_385023 [Tricharina praecox]KAI5857847.1 hypothetical protein BZA05DRAFT_385023 [Tricharina praecox]